MTYDLKFILNNNLDMVRTARKIYEQFLPLNPKESEYISEYFYRMETFTSNHIEGNNYTFGQTNYLITTGFTPNGVKAKDTFEIINVYNSLKFLEECQEEITEDLIKLAHRIITAGTLGNVTYEGQYKKQRNWVGNIETSAPSHVPVHMKKLIDWYNDEKKKGTMHPIVLASNFKYRFLKIHPFIDGNGRTSRWIFNYMMKCNGYLGAIIYPEYKEEYYEVLNRCTKFNADELALFMCKCIQRHYEEVMKFLRSDEDE